MERLRKFWKNIRARVINGLLIAGLILATLLLIVPDTLAEFVGSISIVARLLILAVLYIPIAWPAYQLFQKRREAQSKKTNVEDFAVSNTKSVSSPITSDVESVQQNSMPKPEIESPPKAKSDDLNMDNEDDFYTMLRSMSDEESKQNG